MKRPDTAYLELELTCGLGNISEAVDRVRTKVREYLLLPPSKEDLTSLANGLLMTARTEKPGIKFPARAEALETCQAGTRDFLVARGYDYVFENLENYRKTEQLYGDRELRMAVTALILSGDSPEDVASTVQEQLHRTRIDPAWVALFSRIFCLKESLSYHEWKIYLGNLKRTFPAEAELYSCCFSQGVGRDYVLWKLRGNYELADPDALIKKMTIYAGMRFMESTLGPGPDAQGNESALEWYNRSMAGYDRLLKKRVVDHQTKEAVPTDPINLETDAHGEGVLAIEDIEEDVEIPGGEVVG